MGHGFVACVRRALGLVVALGVVLPAGCAAEASSRERSATPATSPAAGKSERGRASYYANSLAGNKTASGERYDPGAMTAAHRSLPFGTLVEVRRKDGRSVRVKINDRGPFAGKGRIIDLSRRAAEELGMIKEGVIDVTVTVVK